MNPSEDPSKNPSEGPVSPNAHAGTVDALPHPTRRQAAILGAWGLTPGFSAVGGGLAGASAWLAGALATGATMSAHAQTPAAAPAPASPATSMAAATAMVESLRAPAWIETNGKRLPLRAGASVAPLQTVVTGEGARLTLKFPEGSVVALGAASSLSLDALGHRAAAGAEPGFFEAALRMTAGTLRYVTAQVQRLNGNQRRVSIRTATATIGIRGTRFWAQSNPQNEIVCLFEGRVEIARAAEPVAVLDQPNAFWQAPAGASALPVGIATPEQLRGFGGQVAAPAGSGIATASGAFSVVSNIWRESRAQALAAQLGEQGFAATITPCASGAASMFDVSITQLASEADARVVATAVSALVGRSFDVVAPAK